MNSSEKLYEISEKYDIKCEGVINAEDNHWIRLCAYTGEYKPFNIECTENKNFNGFFGSGSTIEEAINNLYDEFLTAERRLRKQ